MLGPYESASPSAAAADERLKVLIADPDPFGLERLARVLSAEDFQVVTALDGEQAVAQLVGSPAHIVIVDVGLELDVGQGLVAYVKEHAPHVPIIALSDDPSWETAQRVRVEQGPVFYYALKPIEFSEVREAVLCAAAVCRRRRSRRL